MQFLAQSRRAFRSNSELLQENATTSEAKSACQASRIIYGQVPSVSLNFDALNAGSAYPSIDCKYRIAANRSDLTCDAHRRRFCRSKALRKQWRIQARSATRQSREWLR